MYSCCQSWRRSLSVCWDQRESNSCRLHGGNDYWYVIVWGINTVMIVLLLVCQVCTASSLCIARLVLFFLSKQTCFFTWCVSQWLSRSSENNQNSINAKIVVYNKALANTLLVCSMDPQEVKTESTDIKQTMKCRWCDEAEDEVCMQQCGSKQHDGLLQFCLQALGLTSGQQSTGQLESSSPVWQTLSPQNIPTSIIPSLVCLLRFAAAFVQQPRKHPDQ